jgi:hypothetical protein
MPGYASSKQHKHSRLCPNTAPLKMIRSAKNPGHSKISATSVPSVLNLFSSLFIFFAFNLLHLFLLRRYGLYFIAS